MKRTFLTLFSTLIALTAYAQPRALGVRAGLEYQVSYEHSVGERSNFVEVDLGMQLLGRGLNAAVAYNFMIVRPDWTRRGEWGFYLGPAVKVGHLWVGTYVAAGMQIGLEYNFDFPLQISIDTRPAVGAAIVNRTISLYGGESTAGGIPCISIRYRF